MLQGFSEDLAGLDISDEIKAKIQSEVTLPHSIPHEVTSQSEYRKVIETRKTETIEGKNLDTKEGRDIERKRKVSASTANPKAGNSVV